MYLITRDRFSWFALVHLGDKLSILLLRDVQIRIEISEQIRDKSWMTAVFQHSLDSVIPWSSIDRASDNLREEYFNERFSHKKEREKERSLSCWYLGWHKEKETFRNLTLVFHRVVSSANCNVKCFNLSFSYSQKLARNARRNRMEVQLRLNFLSYFFYLFVPYSIFFRKISLSLSLFYLRETFGAWIPDEWFNACSGNTCDAHHVINATKRSSSRMLVWRKPETILPRWN